MFSRVASPVVGTVDTPRLVLRPFAPDDWRAVHANASDAVVRRSIPGGAMSADQVRAFVSEHESDAALVAAPNREGFRDMRQFASLPVRQRPVDF
jgi:hypothetical protein